MGLLSEPGVPAAACFWLSAEQELSSCGDDDTGDLRKVVETHRNQLLLRERFWFFWFLRQISPLEGRLCVCRLFYFIFIC